MGADILFVGDHGLFYILEKVLTKSGGKQLSGAGGWGADVDWEAARKRERRCCPTISLHDPPNRDSER